MDKISLEEFRRRIKAQNVSDRLHAAFKCPMCKTVQSLKSFISVGEHPEQAEKLIGFSCVGRVTKADPPRKVPDGLPCNWSLGGLFKLHELEVIDEEGSAHPYFEVATAEEAQALEAAIVMAEAHQCPFKIFTSIGNFEEKAESPKEATAMVIKANPGILIKKIKRVKEFGK